MKTVFSCMLLVVIVSVSNAQYVGEREENLIKVSGSAIVEKGADFASFEYSVRGTAASLESAVKKARDKVALINSRLFEIGLKEKDLFTSRFYSSENTEDKAFLSSSRDYAASIKVVVQLDSLALLDKAIITVSEQQPQTMSAINYQLKDYEQAKLDALQMAVSKAQEKAQLIKSTLAVEKMDVAYVEELSTQLIDDSAGFFSNAVMPMSVRAERKTGQQGFFPETFKIQSSVIVHFKIK